MSAKRIVYLRIPVARNGFVDPPNINWSNAKEEELWAVLSKSKKTDVNWSALSAQFGVPPKFLQQQAYWLYEKELEQLRSRIQKDASLSSDTITDTGVSQHTLVTSNRHLNIFDSGTTTKQPVHLDPVHEVPNASDPSQFHYQERNVDSDSESSSSSSSSLEEVVAGSMLLQRSKILSRAPPRLRDIDDEDEDEDDYGGANQDDDSRGPATYTNTRYRGIPPRGGVSKAKTTTVESSISNLSSDGISKSALEEAMLDNGHFS